MIKALRLGSKGEVVESWQSFLRGSDYPVLVDGDYGPKTREATIAWQQSQGIRADGVVGSHTMMRAVFVGWTMIEPHPAADPDTVLGDATQPIRWPLLSWREKADMFGEFKFEEAPTKDNPEAIKIVGTWSAENIVRVNVPKSGGRHETIYVHRKVRTPLLNALRDIEEDGLLDLIIDWHGGWVPRYKRGRAGGGLEALSAHSFGSAFDVNRRWNQMGRDPAPSGTRGSVVDLVPYFAAQGFSWGGYWADGMHFELSRLT